jgi:polygalacturonase
MELSPRSAEIETKLNTDSRTFGFEIAEPGKWVVTMDGHERLFLFAEGPLTKPTEIISVLNYGADPTGKSLSTDAIQAAIDQAPAGATVVVPAGHFLSGSLFVRSKINLYLEAGALLQASGDPDHFESLQNAFIVIENAEGVTLYGRGTIDGSGAFLRHLTNVSGRLLAIRDSRNVAVEGIILRNPRAWNTHIIRSADVTLRNVKILNDREVLNTDGINPDSSRHVLIEDSFFYCGDDAVAVKSTNRDGRFEDVYDITIRDNIMLTQKSALKVGTETHAAEMRDILFENNQVNPF